MISDLKTGLKNMLEGELILPSEQSYDEARKVYNGMIDKRPAAIAKCANINDVITCVNFARRNDILLSIRGGGHNAGGLGIADDALVIDLSRMKEIKIDANKRTVSVEGGCLLKELDAATHEFGMTVPSGIFGTTGVSGITLGGGLGHLTRKLGLTIDNMLEADVVLANGRLVKASAKENPDLFWALRGGGGNFGVVVSFLFKLSSLATVYGGPMLWELEDAKEILKWYQHFITDAPDDINGFFAFLTVPPVEPFPAHLHNKKMCGVVWCYAGEMSKAEEIFKPIRSVKTPALDFVGPLPVPALQTMFDALYPPGMQWYWKADFVKELNETAVDIHAQFGSALPSGHSTMHLYPVNGAASRIGKSDTAWNYRNATWGMVIVGVDQDPSNKDKIISWARKYWEALHPYSCGGAYINMMMEEGEDRIKASYGDNYRRLSSIKAKYDPANLFRVNQNIKPAMAESELHK